MADFSAYGYFLLILIAVDFCIMLDDMIPFPSRSVLSGVKTGVLSIPDFANAGEHGYWDLSGVFPLLLIIEP